ncbi:hypothetical protein [Streptomyces sp. NPDC048845]|uniref:hypothetical protein n=1 Tax=Streptomyces sp. NPDC048845 TaxID=3155390 RepID=UPI003422DA6C
MFAIVRIQIVMFVLVGLFFLLLWLSGPPSADGSAQRTGPRLTEREEDFLAPLAWVAAGVFCVALAGLLVAGMAAAFQGGRRARIALRYTLIMQIAAAISACATARQAGGERAAREFRSVAKQLAKVSRGIERSHRTCGTVPRWSHRRRALKSHERLVVGALRRAESRLDASPVEGLRELGELLVTIAESYVQGRVSVLLSDEDLQEVEPEPDHGRLRWFVALGLSIASIVGVTLLDLPSAAEPYVISSVALLVTGLVYGPSVRRAVDIIEISRGGAQ